MSKLSKETLQEIVRVQKLLKGMYESGERRLEQNMEEYKKPQDEKDANESLLKIGLSHGVMMTTTHISKFINELIDGEVVERVKKNKKEKKFWDIKDDGSKVKARVQDGDEYKEVDMNDIPQEDKKEMLEALSEAFGIKIKVED